MECLQKTNNMQLKLNVVSKIPKQINKILM
jgi:hypothetical protein